MTYRFLHTADVHLDSPLGSLALCDPELASLIGDATRQAFVNACDLCLAEQVDALLLAGDLYDGNQTSMKTARFLAGQLRRLHEVGIRVFIIRGNHDALSGITQELVLPESVTLFGAQAGTVSIERGRGQVPIAIHGVSFARPHAPKSLLGEFAPPVPTAVNIGMLHTSLGGSPNHDPYAPCSVADLQSSGFRYWALGHIHQRSVVEGSCTVVMPGNPQGRDINEAGPKSVSLVTVQDDGTLHVEERSTGIAQFERVTVDATGLDDWRELASHLSTALRKARDAVSVDQLVARVQVTGGTPLAWRIRSDMDLLKTEADDRASMIGGCWVEKLEIACQTPGEKTASGSDPLVELRRIIANDVSASDSFRQEATAIADELRKKLPPDCRHLLGVDEAAFHAVLAELTAEGSDDVLALLHAAGGDREA